MRQVDVRLYHDSWVSMLIHRNFRFVQITHRTERGHYSTENENLRIDMKTNFYNTELFSKCVIYIHAWWIRDG